jgi:RNA polymerase sigma-70 factor (ECF subfamily)
MTMDSSPTLSPGAFLTTRWTRVCAARSDSAEGLRALADLCDAYYEPVVAFLRCELRDADTARELSHAFFAKLLAGGTIDNADPARGRFRSYLLGAVKHFLSHERTASQRVKRGGGAEVATLDATEALEVPDARHLSPDDEFDRQWALTVLARALESLRTQCHATGREAFFEQAKPWLTGDAAHGDQVEVAASCGMSTAAFKMAVHRLKQDFRQRVKAEIAGTLNDPAMVAAEMGSLFAALSARAR